MKLSNHQQKVFEESVSILKDSNFLVIKGSAGVGKTFLVGHLISSLNGKSLVTAPTHKAVQVLREKIQSDRVQFSTIHSALGLKRYITKRGKEVFKVNKYSKTQEKLSSFSYLVVDEASMLSKELLGILLAEASGLRLKVIFLGDGKQLPPVNEKVSPVFTQGFKEVELTEIVRQGNTNPIIKLSRNLHLIDLKKSDFVKGEDNSIEGFVYSNDKEAVLDVLTKNKNSRYLSYTNRTANLVNKAVREKLFENPRKIEAGETIIFHEPYEYQGIYFHTDQELLINNFEVFRNTIEIPVVRDGELTKHPFTFKAYGLNKVTHTTYTFDFNEMDDIKEEEHSFDAIVLHEDSEEEYKNLLEEIAQSIKLDIHVWDREGIKPWSEVFYPLKEYFANIRHSYASTIHKSQGSTYEVAILDVGDAKKCFDKNEKEKLLYTAVTRPSKTLILFNT